MDICLPFSFPLRPPGVPGVQLERAPAAPPLPSWGPGAGQGRALQTPKQAAPCASQHESLCRLGQRAASWHPGPLVLSGGRAADSEGHPHRSGPATLVSPQAGQGSPVALPPGRARVRVPGLRPDSCRQLSSNAGPPWQWVPSGTASAQENPPAATRPVGWAGFSFRGSQAPESRGRGRSLRGPGFAGTCLPPHTCSFAGMPFPGSVCPACQHPQPRP